MIDFLSEKKRNKTKNNDLFYDKNKIEYHLK